MTRLQIRRINETALNNMYEANRQKVEEKFMEVGKKVLKIRPGSWKSINNRRVYATSKGFKIAKHPPGTFEEIVAQLIA